MSPSPGPRFPGPGLRDPGKAAHYYYDRPTEFLIDVLYLKDFFIKFLNHRIKTSDDS